MVIDKIKLNLSDFMEIALLVNTYHLKLQQLMHQKEIIIIY